MEISLTTPARKLFALGFCVIFALTYCGFVCTRYVAEVLGAEGTARILGLAARLEPGDADYQFQIGKYYAQIQSWPDAAKSFGRATELNPYRAEYWLNLAVADAILNRQTYLQDLQRAGEVDPNQPEVALRAAQIHFANGDIDAGLKNLQKVLESSVSLSPQALLLAWEVKPDIDGLLQYTVPHDSAVYSLFLDLLLSKQQTAAAARLWAQMVSLGAPVQQRYILEYVQYLLEHREPVDASVVWRQASDLGNLKSYQATPGNLIVNSNFSLPILNSGFDWTFEKRPDVSLALDPEAPLFASPSLLLTIDSRGLDDLGISQAISVKPNTPYYFSGYFKAGAMEGAGGLHFVLRDHYSGKQYFESDVLKGAETWKQITGQFETGADTVALNIKIKREPPGSPMRGKLWISGLRLWQRESTQ